MYVCLWHMTEGCLRTPIVLTFQTKIFLPVLCLVQNDIKYNIMQFTCETQNERKGMITTFFPSKFSLFLGILSNGLGFSW